VLKGYCTDLNQEAQTRSIEMHDDDDEALHSLLEFLYTGDYSHTLHGQEDASLDAMQNVRKHSNVYTLAEKYDLELLKRLAGKRASDAAEWISPAAYKHGL